MFLFKTVLCIDWQKVEANSHGNYKEPISGNQQFVFIAIGQG